jgi:putative peptidoglycan lipid II flippase
VRFALARVALSLTLGVLLALVLPRALDLNPLWGVAGLTVASSAGAWIEFALLRRALSRRVGAVHADASRVGKLWLAAILAAAAAWLVRIPFRNRGGIAAAALIVLLYGVLYLLITWRFGFRQIAWVASRMSRLRRGRAT